MNSRFNDWLQVRHFLLATAESCMLSRCHMSPLMCPQIGTTADVVEHILTPLRDFVIKTALDTKTHAKRWPKHMKKACMEIIAEDRDEKVLVSMHILCQSPLVYPVHSSYCLPCLSLITTWFICRRCRQPWITI